MRISDWSSDVCSSDLLELGNRRLPAQEFRRAAIEKNGGEAESGSEEQLMIRLCASGFGTGQYLGIKTGASHGTGPPWAKAIDRKSDVTGKSVSVRVDLGGRRILKKKTTQKK